MESDCWKSLFLAHYGPMKNKKVILTGDRPSGQLHLGHFVGSLKNRVKLQKEYDTYIMIADAQALTDNFENPAKVKDNVLELALDYLAVGIDPTCAKIFIQSQIPELFELATYFLNLVSINRIGHNPTVKEECKSKGFEASVPAGFYLYPLFQVADIVGFNADLVPVGLDQAPMLELARDVVKKFNATYKTEILNMPEPLFGTAGRLSGVDGLAKMSKSLGNAIYLSDDSDVLKKKVRMMYTDPGHIKVEDPGKIEGNIVFEYLDVFCEDKAFVMGLKEHYQRGGLGDMKLKGHLLEVLESVISPIREKREQWKNETGEVQKIVSNGTNLARERARGLLSSVKKEMLIDYEEIIKIST